MNKDKLLKEFVEYLKKQNLSLTTIYAYSNRVKSILNKINRYNASLDEVTEILRKNRFREKIMIQYVRAWKKWLAFLEEVKLNDAQTTKEEK